MITHLRQITQCSKSLNLRRTATEVLSTIIRYFDKKTDSDLLIDFAELLLSLLRDDDIHVRSSTSKIVMDLISEGDETRQCDRSKIFDSKVQIFYPFDSNCVFIFNTVIPLAAEDHLLEWLDTCFVEVTNVETYSLWLQLLRLIYYPMTQNSQESIVAGGGKMDNNLIDVDIFDDTEPNTFDETVFTCYKCLNNMLKHIDRTATDTKEQILSEFSTLNNL